MEAAKMIGRSALIFLAALPAAAADAAQRRTTAAHVAAAADRCGLRGLAVHREGPRRFHLEPVAIETTITVEEGPISPERERQMQAEAEAAMRPWNCLMRWGRQRR